MDQESWDPSTGQLSYIEKVRRLIEDLKKPGDFVSMSEILGKLMDLVRSSFESHPIPSHQREVDYFSNFRAIMQGDLPKDREEMFTILEYMAWALYGVVARAATQGVGHTEPKEIRTILKLVRNASMNACSDGEATNYWMRRPAISDQEAMSLNRFSSQRYSPCLCDLVLNSQVCSSRRPSRADSHQEDKHPALGRRLYWRRGKDKIDHVLKQFATPWSRRSQRWTDEKRAFVYHLKGEDSADVLRQVTRKFPDLGDVDMDELEDVRSQYDSSMYHDKLFD